MKGNTPSLQRAAFDAVQASGPGRDPDHTETAPTAASSAAPSGVADAGDTDFPHVTRVARIRRDRYDADGALVSKEIIYAVTSLDAEKATAEALAAIARGQWGIESVHWSRATVSASAERVTPTAARQARAVHRRFYGPAPRGARQGAPFAARPIDG